LKLAAFDLKLMDSIYSNPSMLVKEIVGVRMPVNGLAVGVQVSVDEVHPQQKFLVLQDLRGFSYPF